MARRFNRVRAASAQPVAAVNACDQPRLPLAGLAALAVVVAAWSAFGAGLASA
jgi:hypothetical protein